MGAQADKARALRELHVPGAPLVLVNAWDVASARTVARVAGCRAIATASAGIAAALGYPDGEAMARDEMLAAVARICAAVDVPVTADLEAGYGDAAATAEGAIAAGAVGLNLEDSDHAGGGGTLVDVDAHAAAVAAVRETGARAGVPLVINARTDVFLRGIGEPGERVALAAARANAYAAAGADCCFVPGALSLAQIADLVMAIDAPVSVIAGAGSPSVAELAGAGVARISTGPFGHRAALAAYEAAAARVYADGAFDALVR